LSPGKEELVSATPEPAAPVEPPPADPKAKSEPTPVATDPAKTAAAKPEKEPTKTNPEPSKPSKEPVKEVVKEPVKPVVEPAKTSVESAKKPRSEDKPIDKTAKAEPKAESKTNDKSGKADNPAWVEALDANAWVMQHGAFESLTEARNFQATSLGFQSGQVLYTQRKGSKPYYILVTGPYKDRAQAESLMKQNPPLAKAWVRSAKSLKAQFQD
jgi:septal ring-binding cell division protein DamX